jgi:peptide/nickel transport system ATP-binding protein
MGLGLVLVSHDVAVVRKVADRIVVLDAGRVMEDGPSHQVSSAPRSLSARRLIEAAPAFGTEGNMAGAAPAPERGGPQQAAVT